MTRCSFGLVAAAGRAAGVDCTTRRQYERDPALWAPWCAFVTPAEGSSCESSQPFGAYRSDTAHTFAMDSSIVLEEAAEEGNLYTSAVAEVWIYLSTSVY